MLYFTGSGDFNMKMRSFALEKGYTINEYSIKNKKTDEEVSGIKTERDIFKFLVLITYHLKSGSLNTHSLRNNKNFWNNNEILKLILFYFLFK